MEMGLHDMFVALLELETQVSDAGSDSLCDVVLSCSRRTSLDANGILSDMSASRTLTNVFLVFIN